MWLTSYWINVKYLNWITSIIPPICVLLQNLMSSTLLQLTVKLKWQVSQPRARSERTMEIQLCYCLRSIVRYVCIDFMFFPIEWCMRGMLKKGTWITVVGLYSSRLKCSTTLSVYSVMCLSLSVTATTQPQQCLYSTLQCFNFSRGIIRKKARFYFSFVT